MKKRPAEPLHQHSSNKHYHPEIQYLNWPNQLIQSMQMSYLKIVRKQQWQIDRERLNNVNG